MSQHGLLKRIYLFRDATEDDLAALAALTERKEYLLGDHVYREGDAADAMFVVEMGTVDILREGKEIVFASIGSGQAFGEVAFFDRSRRAGSARTHELSRILRIPYDRLDKLLADRPALALTCYRHACAFLAKHLRSLALDHNRRYL
jgi:CRP-like cAMP-binding protein